MACFGCDEGVAARCLQSLNFSNSDAVVCLHQRESEDGTVPQTRPNRRSSIGKSGLANKWKSRRRHMSIKFQALHFALYGPDFKVEACDRKLNLDLVIDAMRAVLDKEEFTDFKADVNKELNVPGAIDGMRYVEHFRTSLSTFEHL